MMGNSYPLTPIVVGVLTAMMVGSSALAASPTAQPSVDERLQRIERIIENPVLLQLSRRLGEQQREIQELQDQIDFLKRDLSRINRTSDKRYKESDDRLSALESATKSLKQEKEARLVLPVPVTPTLNLEGGEMVADVESGIEPQGGEQALSQQTTIQDNPIAEAETEEIIESSFTPIKTRPATEEEKGAYQFAFSLLKNSQYENAIKAFQSFLDSFPKSDLASNSAYWMGEAFYIEQDHQAALNAFNRVVKGYPFSSKVPDAMLRAGDCYDNLAQKSQAKALYAELIALYPKTRAAEKAIKRLEKLK
ncbi:MAG: tol-pal system protein YbgF [Thiomicrorhabdus sp.]|nr:tol-pal system protein YbgF [Thiomicrorhabdus sp.]